MGVPLEAKKQLRTTDLTPLTEPLTPTTTLATPLEQLVPIPPHRTLYQDHPLLSRPHAQPKKKTTKKNSPPAPMTSRVPSPPIVRSDDDDNKIDDGRKVTLVIHMVEIPKPMTGGIEAVD